MRQPRIPWSRLFAEFAVIVLGVTVALLADEWRAGRMDRETERVLLGRLATDLRTDIETAGRSMRHNNAWCSIQFTGQDEFLLIATAQR